MDLATFYRLGPTYHQCYSYRLINSRPEGLPWIPKNCEGLFVSMKQFQGFVSSRKGVLQHAGGTEQARSNQKATKSLRQSESNCISQSTKHGFDKLPTAVIREHARLLYQLLTRHGSCKGHDSHTSFKLRLPHNESWRTQYRKSSISWLCLDIRSGGSKEKARFCLWKVCRFAGFDLNIKLITFRSSRTSRPELPVGQFR